MEMELDVSNLNSKSLPAIGRLAADFVRRIESYGQCSLRFEMGFAVFDSDGVPYSPGELDRGEHRRIECMPILLLENNGDCVEWLGPVKFADPTRNGKTRYLDEVNLARMHWYSSKTFPGSTTAFEDEPEATDVPLYMTKGGFRAVVPEVFGVRLSDIPAP